MFVYSAATQWTEGVLSDIADITMEQSPKGDTYNEDGVGTVFGSINRDALNSMPIIIPSKEEMDWFEEIVAPMDAAIRNNYEEICHLETIRDSLLPRLMSGEIDVSDIDLLVTKLSKRLIYIY